MAATSAGLRAWLTLLRVSGLGPARLLGLIETAGGAEAALADGARLARAQGLPGAVVDTLAAAPDQAAVERDLAFLAQPDCALITWDDPRYPPQLREIQLPPPALFVRGCVELLGAAQLAIVGSRSATPQGKQDARCFAAELSAAGLVITSGLALGIDGAAHRGALEAGRPTVAVCGNGLDRVYPARHRELAHAIAETGALVSEFPPGTPPKAEHFPRRNRIISGLALGVLVVEAAPASGSLITARLAAEQGREVFAVPGSIHSPRARGCHALIRDGAKLVETSADVLEELRLPAPAAAAAAQPPAAATPADPLQARILEAIGDAAVSVDTLIQSLDEPPQRLHPALLALELDGAIVAGPGDTYSRLRSR
ncbi:MAG: DNA-processing protein DprA [Gammaproteobacteria bacterium]|nr:DNA-processing protein DprA [Gammaproteobacteria bacterium]